MDTRKYLPLFVAEAREHLNEARRRLADWDPPARRRATARALYRHFHSIKGMAATLGLEPLRAAADAGEEQVGRGDVEAASAAEVAEALSGLLDSMERELVCLERELHTAASPPSVPATPSGEARAAGGVRVVMESAARGLPDPADVGGLLEALSRVGEVWQCTVVPGGSGGARPGVRVVAHLSVEPAGNTGAVRDAVASVRGFRLAELDPLPAASAPPEAVREAEPWIRVPVGALHRLHEGLLDFAVQFEAVAGAVAAAGIPGAERRLHRGRTMLRELNREVEALRLVPFGRLHAQLEQIATQTAARLGRKVRMTMRGAGTRLEPATHQALANPLMHLIRNAVDHGIEPPAERRALGKPEEGSLRIAAELRAGHLVVSVEDDGRGVDLESARLRAVELGLAEPETVRGWSDEQVLALLARPGFSTRETVTEVSGRGVGLDVVQAQAESLGGSVSLSSTPGRGTRVALLLPQSRGFLPAVLVQDGDTLLALPLPAVRAVRRDEASSTRGPSRETKARPECRVEVEGPRGRRRELPVGAVLGTRDLILAPVPPGVPRERYLGAGRLDDGRIVLVLDPAWVVGRGAARD